MVAPRRSATRLYVAGRFCAHAPGFHQRTDQPTSWPSPARIRGRKLQRRCGTHAYKVRKARKRLYADPEKLATPARLPEEQWGATCDPTAVPGPCRQCAHTDAPLASIGLCTFNLRTFLGPVQIRTACSFAWGSPGQFEWSTRLRPNPWSSQKPRPRARAAASISWNAASVCVFE